MNKKIPKFITIRGLKIEIKIVKKMPEEVGHCIGCAYPDKALIILLAGQAPSKMEQTLWHEIAHHVAWQVFFNGRDLREEQIELLADCLRTLA